MAVPQSRLVYSVGGETLERYGTLVKRTSSEEELVEHYAATDPTLYYDENGVLRQAAANVPRVSWEDVDGDGVREALLILERQLTQYIEFNIPGGSEASFEPQSLSAVTNLAGEYGVRVEDGDDLRYTMPANFDPNSFTMSAWFVPDFNYNDGATHFLWAAVLNGNDYVAVSKTSNNVLSLYLKSNGATTVYSTLAPPFLAGIPTFVGFRVHAGTATIYADTDADNVLETNTVATGIRNAGTYTAYVGKNGFLPQEYLEGAVNLLVTSHGRTADPITDRFNAGAGMELDGDDKWLARYGEDLVLHIGGDSTGSAAQVDSFQGATDLLDTTDGGRYNFAPTTDYIDFSNTAEFDAATKVSMMWEIEVDATGSNQALFLSDNAGISSSSLSVTMSLGTDLYAYFTSGSNYERTPFVHSAGDRFLLGLAVDLGLASTARAKFYVAWYDSVTRRYGKWTEITAGKTEGGTVPASLATETGVHRVGAAGGTLDGKIDDFRWKVGVAHDFTSIKPTVHEANPAHWSHWYNFDTNANDQIGSLNGTVTGATLVDDGRHNFGRFERWTNQGRYYFDGVNDDVSLGNVTALDGATAFSMYFVFEVADLDNTYTFYSRYAGTAATRQIDIRTHAGNDSLAVEILDGIGGTSANGETANSSLVAGVRYAAWIRYDGKGTTNAERLRIALATFDHEAGKWGAFAEGTLVFTGTIPAHMNVPTSSTTAYLGRISSGQYLKGTIDDFRLWANQALDTADLDAMLPYQERDAMASSGLPLPDHWWTLSEASGSTAYDMQYAGANMDFDRPTFARADTGTQVYADGVVRAVISGELRNKHVAGRGPHGEGAYYCDGTGDYISYATDALGIAGVTKWSTFLVDSFGPFVDYQRIFCEWDEGDVTSRIGYLATLSDGRLFFIFATDDAGTAVTKTTVEALTAGQNYALFLVYDGTLAAASRLRMWYAAVDEYGAIGSWSEFTFTGGTTPAAMHTPSGANPVFRLHEDSQAGGGAAAEGTIDDFRFIAGTAHTTTERDAQTLYTTPEAEIAAGTWDHWFPMDGDPDDRIGTLTGTVTNAVLVSDGRRHITGLLERAYTNLIGSDNLGTWTPSGTPVITGSVADPAGGTGAYNLADDDGASGEYVGYTLTFTGDGTKSVKLVVREGASSPAGGSKIQLDDNTAAVSRMAATWVWQGGEPIFTVAVGSVLGKRKLANSYWAVDFQVPSVVAANSNAIYVLSTAVGTDTGDIDVYRVNVFNSAVPPASILAASEVTTADSLTVPLKLTTPQEATYLYEGVVLDLPSTGIDRYVFSIGSGSTSSISLAYTGSANRLTVRFHNGTSVVTGYWTVSLSLGDRFSVRIYQASNGAITAGLTLNDATEDTTLDGTINTQALAPSWANSTVRFGDLALGWGNPSNTATISFKAQSGAEKSLATMRALDQPDIAHYEVGDQLADIDGTISGALRQADGRMPEGWTVSGAPEIDRTRWLARKTVTRSTEAGYWDGEKKLLRKAPAGHARDRDWVTANDGNEYRVLRLEGASAAGWTYPEDQSNAAWTKNNVTVSADAIHAPDGTVTADRLVEAAVTDVHRSYRSLGSPTDNTFSCPSIFAKAGERTFLYIRGDTKAAAGSYSFFDLANGVVYSASVNHTARIEDFGNGWYRCSIAYDVLAGASAPNVVFGISTDGVSTSYLGDVTKGLYVWGAHPGTDKKFPSSYTPGKTAAFTRSADSFADVYTAVPQEATYLYEGIVLDLPNTGAARYLATVGASATSSLSLYLDSGTAQVHCYFHNGSTTDLGTITPSPPLALGDHITVRVYQGGSGALAAYLAVNGGAESAFSGFSTIALPVAWANATVQIGGRAGDFFCNSGVISFKAQSGAEKSLATMQALTEDDASTLYFYAPGQYTDEGMYGVRIKASGVNAEYSMARSISGYVGGSWATRLLRGRRTSTNPSDIRTDTGSVMVMSSSIFLVRDSLTPMGNASRALTSGSATSRVVYQLVETAIFDDLRIHSYATVAASTATKGTALPALAGFGNASGVADAEIVADLSAQADTSLPIDAALGTAGTRVYTGPSGTQNRSYVFGDVAGLNGLTPGSAYSMVVGVYIPTARSITPANVKLRCVDSAGSTVGDAMTTKGSWQWLRVQRTLDAGATYAYFELQIEDGENFAFTDDWLYMVVPTVVDGLMHATPILNSTEGTVTQAAQSFYVDYQRPAQAATLYMKFHERLVGTPGRLAIVGSWASGGGFMLNRTGSVYEAGHNNGSSSVDPNFATAPAVDTIVELSLILYSNGSVGGEMAVDGVDKTALTTSAANALLSGLWGTQRLSIASDPDDASIVGGVGVLAVKLALGNYTLDEMRDAV